jgi:hypothetical protein
LHSIAVSLLGEMESEEWKAEEPERRDGEDEGTLLPYHEARSDTPDSDSEDDELQGRKSVKGILFIVLATTSTLAGRRILRDGFRELKLPLRFHVK